MSVLCWTCRSPGAPDMPLEVHNGPDAIQVHVCQSCGQLLDRVSILAGGLEIVHVYALADLLKHREQVEGDMGLAVVQAAAGFMSDVRARRMRATWRVLDGGLATDRDRPSA